MSSRKAFPAQFKKGFENVSDKKFVEVVAISFIVHILIYISLSFVKISEEISIKKVPIRFAKLILEPPRKPAEEETVRGRGRGLKEKIEKMEETEKEAEERAEAEAERRRREREEAARRKAAAARAARERAARAVAARRGAIGRGVRARGALKILTGRGPSFRGTKAVDALGIFGVKGGDVDEVLDRIVGIKRVSGTGAGLEEIGGEGGLGGGGRRGGRIGRRATIDDLIAPTPGPEVKELKKVGNIKVEVPEEITGEAASTAARSYEAIKEVVMSKIKGIEYLYKRALRRNPELRGKIVVRFTIDEQGNVLSPEIVSSTLNCPTLEQGLLRRIRTWKFPPTTGGSVTVRYPFIFFPEI
jgi:TonB family protein